MLVNLVSIVVSKSAFSARGRVLDSFRSSLITKMVEPLICAQYWDHVRLNPLYLEEHLENLEKI